MSSFPLITFNFLKQLQNNNNREWFEKNRKNYLEAKVKFEEFVSEILKELEKFENLGDLTAKQCIFRINRDIRFSSDKTPYKRNMSAAFALGGKKSPYHPYYLHIEPGGKSFLGGGLYDPDKEKLTKVRQEIDYNKETLIEIIENREFKKYFTGISGEKLKTAPKGYPKDHPDINLLKFKQYIIIHQLNNGQILDENFSNLIIDVFKVMKPFLDWLNFVIIDKYPPDIK
ncbi:DUF2461 domain-containing protein [soil metagenome]